MKKNYFLYFIVFIIFTGCGYAPIYKNIENINFKIKISDISGERKINNLIQTNLKNYSFNNSKKTYDVLVKTKYSKNIIAKNSTGAATEYKIIIEANFRVKSLDIENEYKFKESFNMQSMSDKLDEQDYEENIQSNLVNTITRKLILSLSRLK